MQLQDILYSQGFGTRRVCCGLVQQGLVGLGEDAQPCTDPTTDIDPEGLVFHVQGQRWAYQAHAYLMLNKPIGHECSQKPSAWPSIYTLLPAPLRARPSGAASGVQAVGRLDQDTTGLLLMSDDGKFIHRLSSPKHHVPKVYEATCKHPITAQQVERLLAGVVLDDDPKPVRATACAALDSHVLQLTLTEGKYHQVKRMIAAVSNRVEALHRSQIGPVELPEDLPPGGWRWLTPAQVTALMGKK
ncbi:MAG TPA: 16S rRNA pseudouridine(516) synthase [Macromonas sp.]|nr:16S rRNA pseudouridine(516) synthase [Macromonas sp.]